MVKKKYLIPVMDVVTDEIEAVLSDNSNKGTEDDPGAKKSNEVNFDEWSDESDENIDM